MKYAKLLGLLGSIVLFIGVFTPVISIPFVGNINYLQSNEGSGTIVLILAVISLVLVSTNKYKGLWFTGIGSLGVVLFGFVNFLSEIFQTKTDVESTGNPLDSFLEGIAMELVKPQWGGWILLIMGAMLLIGSAANHLFDNHATTNKTD